MAQIRHASAAAADVQDIRPLRATTITYLLALLVIATISVTSHLVTNRIIVRQSGTAKLINTAGRQRMLSQRIARIAEEMADGTTAAPDGRTQLRDLARQMDTAQHQLLYGDPAQGVPAISNSTINMIYYGAPYHLQAQVMGFVSNTRAFADVPNPTLADPAFMRS